MCHKLDKNIKWRNLSPLPSTAWAQYTGLLVVLTGVSACWHGIDMLLVPISLMNCFYFTSSSYILTCYSDSRQWSGHISKARLWTAEECCDLRSSDTFLMNPKLQPPGEFYRGRREKWLRIGGCYKLGTFANKNILRWSTRWPALHIEVFLVTFLAYCALP